MQQVDVQAVPLDKLAGLLTPERSDRFMAVVQDAQAMLAERVVWNVNATAHGGGVAEMLDALLAYGRGAGVDTRWLVLDGDHAFFEITKRVHNALHGSWNATAELGAAEHEHYEQVLRDNLASLAKLVRPGDIVLLHDPQTAGLVAGTRRLGAHVVWRCHVGRDEPNAATDRAWEFLRGYVEPADAFVFSRERYAPDWVPRDRLRMIAPSVDPYSAKNCELTEAETLHVLHSVGLLAGESAGEPLAFTRRDGSAGVVRRHTGLLSGTQPPPPDAPLVVQVSRWDRLKDMAGVLVGFANYVARATPNAHLMLVGPDVSGVSDDPEGAEVLGECRATWAELPPEIADRCHLVSVPMDDIDENAIIVNALQRHAMVVVQKSIAEGFGLTVTEAMWKGRPVLASAVGGIQDQIRDGVDGVLLPDTRDLPGFGQRLRSLLADPARADRMGRSAHERVRDEYLGDRHLSQYAALFAELLGI